MDNPPETSKHLEDVEADKRFILEMLLNASSDNFPHSGMGSSESVDFKDKNSNSNANINSNSNTTTNQTRYTYKDWAELLEQADIDDGEELFEDILKRAEKAFNEQEELKKNNPFYTIEQEIFKKPKGIRKRTCTKALDESFKVIKKFKESLRQVKVIEPNSSSAAQTTKKDKIKSSMKSCISTANGIPVKVYPSWKRTITHTPVLSVQENPNWMHMNIKTSSVSSKMYTPRHIENWMENISTSDLTMPSCRTIRSDAATCNSINSKTNRESTSSASKNLNNTSTPMDSTPTYLKLSNLMLLETKKKNIQPLSVSQINSNENRNILPSFKDPTNSNSFMYYKTPSHFKTLNVVSSEAKNKNIPLSSDNPIYSSTPMRSTVVRFKLSPPEKISYNSDETKSSSSMCLVKENEQSDLSQSFNSSLTKHYCAENYDKNYYNKYKQSLSLKQMQYDYKEYKEEHHFKFQSDGLHETNDNFPQGSKIDDFINNLKRNISNNYNMELKCSMKVKYYSS